MTVLLNVDPGGAVFRGLAVPFGRSALIVDKDGKLIAEQFDQTSIRKLPQNIPLLVGHRRDEPPAGVITSSGLSSFGLGIEGKLVGGDSEIEGWRRRFAEGIMAALSIGFVAEGRQEWRLPERRGAPPLCIRRNVEVVEASLVQWPAYADAAVVSINERTAQHQREHEIAMEMLAEYKARQARAHEESRRTIAETTEFLARTAAWDAARKRRRVS